MYIDFVAALILIFCIIRGEKKGVIETFLSAFGWLFSLFFTLLYSPKLAEFLTEKTELKNMASNMAVQRVKAMIANGDTSVIAGSSTDFPDLVTHSIASSTDSMLERLARPVADNLAETFIGIVAFFLMLFAVKFLVHILERLLSRFHRAKTVGTVDGILGMLFGIVKGGVLIYILISLLLLIAAFSSYEPLIETIQSSVCVETIESHNLFFFGEDIIEGISLPQIEA